MKKIYFLSCLLIILFSCNNIPRNPAVLKTSNLKSNFINIKADKSYQLKTGKGAIIKIDSGTFSVPAGKEIQLEIKEAYSSGDMILAGLTTQSNGRILRTGGMIFFNATSQGNTLEFKKPVSISVPSPNYDKDMQLFKGVYAADSTINWVEPIPLDTSVNAKILLIGEALFKANCANCHRPTSDFTGPGLASWPNRYPSKQWVYDFVHSPAAMIGSGDPRSVWLMEKWKPTVMTGFPLFERSAVDAIMAYVDNYAKNKPYSPEYFSTDTSKTNFCGYDTTYSVQPDREIEVQDTTSVSYAYNKDALLSAPDTADYYFPDIPVPMYDFNITANGWYNVDAYSDGATDISLKVQLQTGMEVNMRTYLFCPSKKIFIEGTKKDSYNFTFDDGDGTVPLFLNEQAIVLAFGSKDDKMYYAAGKFNIQQTQVIPIIVKETTEAELKAFMSKNKIGNVTLDIYTHEKTISEIPCAGTVPPDTTKVTNR